MSPSGILCWLSLAYSGSLWHTLALSHSLYYARTLFSILWQSLAYLYFYHANTIILWHNYDSLASPLVLSGTSYTVSLYNKQVPCQWFIKELSHYNTLTQPKTTLGTISHNGTMWFTLALSDTHWHSDTGTIWHSTAYNTLGCNLAGAILHYTTTLGQTNSNTYFRSHTRTTSRTPIWLISMV